MNNEKIRVGARLLLVGKSRVGNGLVLFSSFLHIAVYLLVFLIALRRDEFVKTVGGKTVLGASVFAILSAFVLLMCLRTVKDRWYASVCAGEQASVSDLIIDFNFRDVLVSLSNAILSFVVSSLRIVQFLSFPLAFAVFVFGVVKDGTSVNVFCILAVGNLIAFVCSLIFVVGSLNCVSLARTVSCGSLRKFTSSLKLLDFAMFRLFWFDSFLSVVNRCSRRLSKIM